MAKTKQNNKKMKKQIKSKPKQTKPQSKPKKSLVRQLQNLRLGESVGGVLGNLALPGAGGGIGSLLGKGVDSLFASISGRGAYEIKENSMLGPSSVPVFGDFNSVPIRHKEFIGNVVSTTTSNILKYTINPSNPALFPWLNQIADAFQEYRIKGMIFEFKTLSGSITTSQGLGYVAMCCQYDPYTADPVSKIQIENTEGSVSVVPSSNAILPIECKNSQTVMEHLYIANRGSGDLRMSNFGNMYIMNGGQSANGAILGELWVSYDIELYKKIPFGFENVLTYYTIGTNNYNYTQPFQDGAYLPVASTVYEQQSYVSFSVVSLLSRLTFIASGDTPYYVCVRIIQSVASPVTPTTLSTSNSTGVITTATTASFGNGTAANSQLLVIQYTVPATGGYSDLTLSGGSFTLNFTLYPSQMSIEVSSFPFLHTI